MDLAQPGRHRVALWRVYDPFLAGFLGDLHPPASADGLDRRVAPRSRSADPGVDRPARGRPASVLHPVRCPSGLSKRPLWVQAVWKRPEISVLVIPPWANLL